MASVAMSGGGTDDPAVDAAVDNAELASSLTANLAMRIGRSRCCNASCRGQLP
jgi:hypothetical protein